MQHALAKIDLFNLNRIPDFEPRRGPELSHYVASAQGRLLFMPIRSAPEETIKNWLASLDGADQSDLRSDFNQTTLAIWQRTHSGHRSFTVIRHPAARAHRVFCSRVLSSGIQKLTRVRKIMDRVYRMKLPENTDDDSYDVATHRTTFIRFLRFLKVNLSNQTNIRIDPYWASQSQTIWTMAQHV